MKWIVDRKNRATVKKRELKARINKVLSKADFLHDQEYNRINCLQNKKPLLGSHKTRINNRCIYTDNSRSIFKDYRQARTTMRKFIHAGCIVGVGKYYW